MKFESVKQAWDALEGKKDAMWGEMKENLIDYFLSNEDAPAPDKFIKEFINRVKEEYLSVIAFADDVDESKAEGTQDAYIDLVHYGKAKGITVAQAAQDYEGNLTDLTWLVAERAPEEADKEDFELTKEHKKLREPKKEKEEKEEKAEKPAKGKKPAKKSKKDEIDEDDDE